jgi:hypothetical protein
MYDPEKDNDDDDYKNYPEKWDNLGKANNFNIDWKAWQEWLLDAIKDIAEEKGSTDNVWIYSTDSKFPVVGSSQDAAKDQYFMYLGSNQYSEGVWKYKDFLDEKLFQQYKNHLQANAAHVLKNPNYYRGLHDIIN